MCQLFLQDLDSTYQQIQNHLQFSDIVTNVNPILGGIKESYDGEYTTEFILVTKRT